MRQMDDMRMETPDEALALAAGRGDREAFSALLSRHYDRIFRLGWRLTGSQAEAEDLAQDICLALPAKLGGWRGEARFTTWLHRVVVNAAHDRRRRAATRTRASDGWGDWELARRAANDEMAEAMGWLGQAMAGLSDDLRDTLALILGEEMTHREAGEILGVSEGTVSWRMSEAKKHLKAIAATEGLT
jgi:RNA polymerase sigma-70 factor (ECF subfamily)